MGWSDAPEIKMPAKAKWADAPVYGNQPLIPMDGGPMPPPRADAPPSPPTGVPAGYRGFMAGADQFGSGLNEGIAGFLGMPVDLATGAMNMGSAGINSAFGTDIAPITAPFGGAGTFKSAMDPLISDVAPQTGSQRYLRRGGQELGFGLPAAMTGAAIPKYGASAREAMASFMGVSLAGDVGAGIAGQTAREIAPESNTADFLASLLGGGGTAFVGSRMTPRLAEVPTLPQLKAVEDSAWAKVKAATETLTDSATAKLSGAVRSALPTSQLAGEAYPLAHGMADKMGILKNPTIYDVEEARRIIGDRVAGDPKEARVGVTMKRAIDEFFAGLKPADLQGGTSDDALGALSVARKTTHQVKKAEAVTNAEMKAETRAASTGTGGNEVNTTRQNIRAIFDKERDLTLSGKRRGYTPDEMAAMERVVMGDAKSNTARLFGRLAPSAGALPLMALGGGGVSGTTAALMTGNPAYALPAVAGGIGELSKFAAEHMTKNQISALLATIKNGGKAVGKSASRDAAQKSILQQLLSTLAQ